MTARTKAKQPDAALPRLTAYELERQERIKANNAVMASMGILEQKTLFESAFRIVKRASIQKKRSKPTIKTERSEPARSSSRLCGTQPEFRGLADDHRECCDGRIELPKLECSSEAWAEVVKERRCDSQSRGSLYDSTAGITCHFCRQKKLCGEPDCKRCSTRDPALPCIGKSECSRCGSANGRFCRACLLIRYGWQLEAVRQQMAEKRWLCPHCYEEDHAEEAWICNSSICMTRRGLKPTGIAIFDAQQQGFASVAHHVQAKLLQHRKSTSQPGGKENAGGTLEPKEAKVPIAGAETCQQKHTKPAVKPARRSLITTELPLAPKRMTRSAAAMA